ncbi:hypothetical protein [Kibdelosporangium phytohabitans]|uniref:Lipoprotein n=1 Tax=Kibdelosporangium phytohabitans TaxID=860235 RepID=A0A0N9I0P2_9PSEU|nr:hypothetical protein [Kibdelosporangium phytohabitans]ALG09572.1 hypothetical protein AOZ06_24095 [Kibdelosporangium phytohabitans]MBE1469102.1 hypothetical protein [Kibdelosporangium phytohabitans]
MRSGKLVLCAGFAALLTACSGGGDTGSGDSTGGGAPEQAQDDASSKRPNFDEIPGESIVYTEDGATIGIKVKTVDSTWKPEVMEKPAAAGSHFLAVWVALTPELPDRGADKVNISGKFYVRYKATNGNCGPSTKATSEGYCYQWSTLSSAPTLMLNSKWRDSTWSKLEYVRTDFERGQTRIAQFGFEVADTVKATEFELCAPSKQQPTNKEKFPCLPVKAPDGTR